MDLDSKLQSVLGRKVGDTGIWVGEHQSVDWTEMFQETKWRQGCKLSYPKCIYMLAAQTKDLDNFLSTVLVVGEEEGSRGGVQGPSRVERESAPLLCTQGTQSVGQTNLSKC